VSSHDDRDDIEIFKSVLNVARGIEPAATIFRIINVQQALRRSVPEGAKASFIGGVRIELAHRRHKAFFARGN